MGAVPDSSTTSAPPDGTPAPALVTSREAAAAAGGGAAAARVAMVARLEKSGDLGAGPVRDALLALPREVLMPQAYARRSAPDEVPPRWDLLDWRRPEDRGELLRLLHSGESVPVQHGGEPLLGRVPGPRRGGSMTAMSSAMGMTAGLLGVLDLRRGQRVLDIGTGAAVTAGVMCFVCGDAGVVTLDVNGHVGAAARARLAELGYRPAVVTGDGRAGCPDGAPFDRIFVSFAVPRVPPALLAQLAPGGRALMTVGTSSPSWPGLAVITKTATGAVVAELRAVELGHRGGVGFDRLFLSAGLRERIATGPGRWTQRSHVAPPADTERGFWLALDAHHPGLVRHFGADDLTIGAPECGSWMRARPVGQRRWEVTVDGPRDIWAELHDVADRWRAAGSPRPTACTSTLAASSG
ncbi:protein-L-isoaspartate O-methyltransferase family protein [Streptomyces angustmyceticus]|uniref:protein-L-isoaspartate O-methyltransferase family protein n=1 Tax=Streptomyces angustmyceticus TaxID=285578 RepID=UPI003D9164A9